MGKVYTEEEFCRYLWQQYLVERNYGLLGQVVADELSVIGTGAHEISRNLEEFETAMARESQEWDGRFIIKDQWYQTSRLSGSHSLVFGEITVKEDGKDGILYDVRFRFSIVLKKTEDGWRVVHIHQSVSDPNQASDEFFPHHMVEENERQIIYNLRHDTLTGVLNRLYLKETVNRFTGDSQKGILLSIDIDKFKSMNDTYGHPFGDKVLKSLSQSLKAAFAGNVIGRIGGDEFVIFFPGIQDWEEFKKMIERFRADWKERQRPLKLLDEVTVSMGSSSCPKAGVSYDELWREADKELYRAKAEGGGVVSFCKRAPMYKVINIKKAADLFAGTEEALIQSCLEGSMGWVYGDDPDNPESVMAMVGDFCFFAGRPLQDLVCFKPVECRKNFMIMAPPDEQWSTLIKSCFGKKAKRVMRYAVKKEAHVWDLEKLRSIVAGLPAEYEMKLIDEEVYSYAREHAWAEDWVSQFPDYESFRKHGLGVVVLKGGIPVSGASSYAAYSKGIEIEIDTREDFRRKGLAAACGAMLILECVKRSIYPGWDAQNLWSLALAEKLGYHFDREYPVYEIWGY